MAGPSNCSVALTKGLMIFLNSNRSSEKCDLIIKYSLNCSAGSVTLLPPILACAALRDTRLSAKRRRAAADNYHLVNPRGPQ